jgi:hypothetical protein
MFSMLVHSKSTKARMVFNLYLKSTAQLYPIGTHNLQY